jgi:ankyrin repeat protein
MCTQPRARGRGRVHTQTRELLEAVSDGNLPKVKQLIADDFPVNAQDDDGNTALIFAAENEPLIVTVRARRSRRSPRCAAASSYSRLLAAHLPPPLATSLSPPHSRHRTLAPKSNHMPLYNGTL